jgi:hypothetical protein
MAGTILALKIRKEDHATLQTAIAYLNQGGGAYDFA